VVLGKTGLEVSPLGFGSANVGYLGEGVKRTAEILNLLLDSGINVVDTAACYPGSEELIAKSVGQRRNEYVLVTKCGHKVEGTTGEEWSKGLVVESVERSLRRLGTDRIDIVLLHSCGLDILRKGEALEALVEAQAAGKIRFVGYSGDNEAAVYAAALKEVSVIETSVSVCDQANIDSVLPICRQNQTGVLVKRALANAAWRDLSNQRGVYQSYAESYHQRWLAMGLSPVALGFEGDEGTDWPGVALRFTLSQEGVHCAVVGTTDPANARDNLEAVRQGPLTLKVVQKIREAFRLARGEEDWTGLT